MMVRFRMGTNLLYNENVLEINSPAIIRWETEVIE